MKYQCKVCGVECDVPEDSKALTYKWMREDQKCRRCLVETFAGVIRLLETRV